MKEKLLNRTSQQEFYWFFAAAAITLFTGIWLVSYLAYLSSPDSGDDGLLAIFEWLIINTAAFAASLTWSLRTLHRAIVKQRIELQANFRPRIIRDPEVVMDELKRVWPSSQNPDR